MGLAGTPHCAAMCGAPCAALTGRRSPGSIVAFQLARVASYAIGGAVAAASMGALASLSQLSPAIRPLWTLLLSLIHISMCIRDRRGDVIIEPAQARWVAIAVRVPPQTAAAAGPGSHVVHFHIERVQETAGDSSATLQERSTFMVPR